MAELTLAEAVTRARVSRSSLLRAIHSGRLSATRSGAKGFVIDPAELARVFPPARPDEAPTHVMASHDEAGEGGWRVTLAMAQAEARTAQALLEAERRRAEELRQERDAWRVQAERLALPAPNGDEELRQERDYWREQAERLALPTEPAPARRWWRLWRIG